MSAPDLFGPVARKPRRVMMQATDSGSFPDGKDAADFHCRTCGRDTGWIYATRTEARRGMPCGTCNPGDA